MSKQPVHMRPWLPRHIVTNDRGDMEWIEATAVRLGKRLPATYIKYLDVCTTVDAAIRKMMRAEPHIPKADEIEDKP